MINYEKYEQEIKEIILNGCSIALRVGKLIVCEKSSCSSCDFYKSNELCRELRKAWLNAEYKEPITLTEREHAFCVAVGSGWLCKDKDGNLSFYDVKPTKSISSWHTGGEGNWGGYMTGILFNFIQWSDTEPYSIEELLKMPVKESE